MAATSTVASIQQLYISYFGRPADPAGLDFWAALAEKNGGSLESIMGPFTGAPEAIALYGGANSVDARIDAIYQNVFGRSPDTQGKAFWKALVESRDIPLENLTLAILTGAHGNADAVLVQNKLAVAQAFTARIEAGEARYDGAAAAAVARTLIKSVSSDGASVSTALAKLPAYLTTLDLASKAPEKFATLIDKGVLKDPSIVSTSLTLETLGFTPSAPAPAPAPVVVPVVFTVTEGVDEDAGKWSVGTKNGYVLVTQEGSGDTLSYVFTPLQGAAVEIPASQVSCLIVDSIVLVGNAAVLNGLQVQGTGHVVALAAEAAATADLSRLETNSVSARFYLGAVSISPKGSGDDDRILDLAGVAVLAGGDYELDIGGHGFQYIAKAGDTAADIAQGLAAEVADNSSFKATADRGVISISGAAALEIEFELEVRFGGKLGKATVTIEGMGEVSLKSEADLGSATFIVMKGAELDGSFEQLNGKVVSGDGYLNIGVTSVSADFDGSGFGGALTIRAEIEGVVDLSGQSVAGIDEFEIYHGAHLTLTAAQASGKTLSRDGDDGPSYTGRVTIVGADGNQEIDVSQINGTESVNSITGGKGADRIMLGGGKDTVVVASGSAGVSSESTHAGMDAITAFDLAHDKLDLHVTELLSTSVHTDISSVVSGVVVFANSAAGNTDSGLNAKLAALFAELGNTQQVAAFKHGSDSYVVASDGVAGLNDGDVVIRLVGTDVTGTNMSSVVI